MPMARRGKDLAELNLLVAQTGVTAAGFWHLSSSTAMSVASNCRVASTFFPSEREVRPGPSQFYLGAGTLLQVIAANSATPLRYYILASV